MAEELKTVVAGAGPAGLGAAWELQQAGEGDWIVLEQRDWPGGLASSVIDENGFTWDLGGHVQFSHYDYFDGVMNELFAPEEWLWHERRSYVWVSGRFIPYPFQNNLRRLPATELARCLAGLAAARWRSTDSPENFREWIVANFGRGIAETFLLPYNFKVWAHPLETMSTQWVGERVALPGFAKTVRNLVSSNGDSAWGPNRSFRFPVRGGTGEIWRRCARKLPAGRIRYGETVEQVDAGRRRLWTSAGNEYQYETLVSTMPLPSLIERAGLDGLARRINGKLPHSSTHIVGVGLRGSAPPEIASKTWMYFPESDCPFYRVTVFSNYSPHNVPDSARLWSLLCETSESSHKPVDAATIVEQTLQGLLNTGLIRGRDDVVSTWRFRAAHGYPVPGLGRNDALHAVLRELEALGIYSRGRFGAWKYEVSNQDHSFMQGIEAVRKALFGADEQTVWHPHLVNNGKRR